jgi:hypothetical protein
MCRLIPRSIVGAALLVALVSRTAGAQNSPGADPVDVLTQYLLKQKLIELPKTTAGDKQVSAPANTNGTTTLVNGPSFPEIIAMAFDNNIAGFKDSVFTVDLNFFAFKAMLSPDVEIDQTRYGTVGNSALRRIGIAVSVGGKGEKFDRNGDGKADDPLTATNLTDVVTTEARFRIFGSRDRRDNGNFRKFTGAVDGSYTALSARVQEFFLRHAGELPRSAQRNANGDPMLDVEKFNAFLATPELQPELKALADAYQAFLTLHGAQVKEIDQQGVWTLAAGLTEHADAFGPDRFHVGLRGVIGGTQWNHTVNVDWHRANEFIGLEAANKYTASYEAARLLFKGTFSEKGVKLSVAANAEVNRDVPDAKYPEIVKGSVAFDIPLGSTMSVPITFSYANHADLLTADHVWAGQIGIAWDFSGKKK